MEARQNRDIYHIRERNARRKTRTLQTNSSAVAFLAASRVNKRILIVHVQQSTSLPWSKCFVLALFLLLYKLHPHCNTIATIISLNYDTECRAKPKNTCASHRFSCWHVSEGKIDMINTLNSHFSMVEPL